MHQPKGDSFVSIVDDDPGICVALKALMRSAGLVAEAFLSAEEFLASGKLAHTACLVLDMQLPGMSGLELQAQLAAAGARVPIVFITAHEQEDKQAAAIQLGAAAFLSKPLCRGVLLQCVLGIIKPSHWEGQWES
jgi:FixJ family two-component response regulator